MKRFLNIILLIIITMSCNNNIQKGKNIKRVNIFKKDSILLRKKALLKYEIDSLPIGVKEIVNSEFNENTNLYITNHEGDLEFNSKFFITPKKTDKDINKYFNNFYRPSLNSSIKTDKYPLYDDRNYINKVGIKSSNIEYVLPKIDNYNLIIFNVYFNYDKEFDALVDATKYLVIYDENLKVVSELNLEFFHETEESNFIKFFFINKDYIINIRYFKDKDKHSEFSELYKYKVTKKGRIIRIR